MRTIDDTRRANLLELVATYGGQRHLADRISKAPAQISQWVTRAPNERGKVRVISTASARQIEAALDLRDGWMDVDHEAITPTRERVASDAAPPPSLRPDQRAILDLWEALDPAGRKAIQTVGHALAQPPVKAKPSKEA